MGGLTGEENKAGKEINVQVGELLWVKLNQSSWWPAQIVDENLVSAANKPTSKASSSEVLVRLYGSYVYKYADIRSLSAEFKSMLMKNHFNYHDILKKSLEKDLPSSNSSKSRKRQQSKSKAKVVNGSSDKAQVSSKKRKQEKPNPAESHSQTPETKNLKPTLDRVHHGSEPSSPNTATKRPEELSARRVKVMQSLGLVAPPGSPFPHNQVGPANPTVLN
ncbi:uncharacterized protein LOC143584037 isoform X2 [Bidens hawaiensis]|uniref:uncharacterized protein LOC143584037 isoform X2 n=1 Tax=Bidens hawaiensis TaxID=980011 RepID=UPI00404A5D93